MSDPSSRLAVASAAWTRLFQQTTRSTINNNDKHHQTTQTTAANKDETTRRHQRNSIPLNDKAQLADPHQRLPTITLTQPYTSNTKQQNTAWGDTIGAKPTDVTRIYSQNVNGIRLEKDGGQFKEICHIHQEVQADIFCIQEHNLDTNQYQVKQIMHQTTRRHWQRSRLNLASSPITFPGTWKPGGTAILSTGSITGRITETGIDEWGRWSYQTYQGQRQRLVTIITIYQVVDTFSKDKGTYTAYAQQRSLLIRQGEVDINPRQAFLRDLTKFIHTKQHSVKHELLILGDFNERIGDNPQGIARVAAEFNLTDIYRMQHPHLQDVATYTRGRKRLDYALGSSRVAQAVRACGYEPFNYRLHTDHRASFIDFDTEILFGSATQTLVNHTSRVLHSNNLKQVTQYIKEKHAMLSSCNAFARAEELMKPGHRHKFAERLDADVLRTSIIAERRTQRFKEPSWSIELARARKKVSILAKTLTMLKTNIDHTAILLQETTSLNEIVDLPTNINECSVALRNAKREVREIVERSFATRETERDEQIAKLEAEIEASRGKPTKNMKAKLIILRNLRKAEAIKRMFQKLQTLRQTRKRGGITRLEVPYNPSDDPKTCTHWKVIDVPTEILDQLQRRNQKHFGQAHGTPFTTPPLSDDLGFTSMTPSGTLILNGQYDVAHLDESVQLIISQLRTNMRAQDTQVHPSITYGDFVNKLTTWRESTSTSPSGLHLGHYKAMLARHEYSDLSDKDPRRAQLDRQQEEILTVHLNLINYALARGYSYRRWQQVANAMIFKEANNIKIHRTRVIHLYEADYNLAMGLKWKAAMAHAEATNIINPGQYGSRPSRGAHDPVFLEEFQLEIIRSSRKSLVQTNYDATSCYDRIIPNLAALVSQRFGVPQPVVQTNASTLEAAQYRLRTELGLSEESYTHSTDRPIYGTGQGSGNSPMIWCFLSSILFDCYETKAHGAIYETPDKHFRTKLHMVGYVDDSNGQTNAFLEDQQPPDETILAMTQNDAQIWNDLLHASGGALELPKCVYQLISWRFLHDGRPLMQGGVSSHKVQVHSCQQDNTSSVQTIPGLSAYTAHKTLGHYKDPNGDQVRQRKELQLKCDNAADFISRSPLNREEAWTYYFAIFLTSVGYPLPSCHFSKVTLDKIQRTVMSSMIAKCGYNRKTKREIIYGPAHLGGANFRSLYSVQGVGQMLSFIKYWRSPCQGGKLLRIAVAWTQLNLGTSRSFLQDTATRLPHMESKWLKSLRDYLKYVNGSIEIDQTYIPTLERVHDFFIMDAILDSHRFSDKEIQQINYCRLYLQAITISDLTQANGTKLDLAMLRGQPDQASSTSQWNHVNQARPDDAQWQLWKEANKLWSDADGVLLQPLQRWRVPINKQRRRWYVYGDTKGRIYAKQECKTDPNTSTDVYIRYHVAPQHDAQNFIVTSAIPPTRLQGDLYQPPKEVRLPTNVTPVDVTAHQGRIHTAEYDGGLIRQHRFRVKQLGQKKGIKNLDFHSFITQTTEPWEADLLQHVRLKHDVFSTYEKMKDVFHAAGDGSVKHIHNGSFGWTISTSNGERLVEAYGPVRGYKPTSYRAEGYGMLSILRFIKQLQTYCRVTPTWSWTLTSDNISLVNKVNGIEDDDASSASLRDKPHDWSIWKDTHEHNLEDPTGNWADSEHSHTNQTLEPDWDVINEIRWTLDNDGVGGATILHIEGHQDRKKAYEHLSLQAQLNVDADRLAAEFQDQFGGPYPEVLRLPHSAAQVHLDNHGTCTYRLPQMLRRAETELPLRQYIQVRNGWTEEIMGMIDWEAHERAIKKNNKRRIHLTKLIHDILPTNYHIHRADPRRQRCLICINGDIEDRDHILRCSGERRDTWRAQMIASLTHRCATLQTDPILARILTEGIHLWLTSDETLMPDKFPPKYSALIRQQNRIGWRQLFSGRLSQEWARLQNDYIFVRKLRQQDTHLTNTYDNNHHNKTTAGRSGHTWAAEVIHEIWERWSEVWAMRNADVHGHDQQTRKAQQEHHNILRLQNIYEVRNQMEPRVREELLYRNVEDHLERSKSTLHNWLATHEATITQSIKNAKSRAIQGLRSIRSYFATGRPPGGQSRSPTRNDNRRSTPSSWANARRRKLQTKSPARP